MIKFTENYHVQLNLISLAIVLLLVTVQQIFGKDTINSQDESIKDIIKFKTFYELLLSSMIVAGQMMITLLLAGPNRETSLSSRIKWKGSLLIPFITMILDLILFILVRSDIHVSSVMLRSLPRMKLVGITGGLICAIPFEGFHPPTKRFFDITTTFATFALVSAEVFHSFEHFYVSPVPSFILFGGSFSSFIAAALLLLAVAKLTICLWPEISHLGFFDYRLHTEYLRALGLLVYSVPALILEKTMNVGDYLLVMQGCQVILLVYLTVISNLAQKANARDKERQLEERLDMIRYISHEMRTPLNTASLGLNSLLSSNAVMKKKIESIRKFIFKEMNKKLSVENYRRDLEYIDKLLKTNEISDQNETLKQVEDSCFCAISTLDDILTIDKLDQGKLVAEFTDLNPWVLVKQMVKPFELSAREKGVNLDIVCVEQDTCSGWVNNHVICGDSFKLGQVIRNLLSNAIKFTPVKGTVTVKLEMLVEIEADEIDQDADAPIKEDCTSTENLKLRISVVDSGAGISIVNQKKLFGRYVQINPGELQKGKGSGLGLWISKKIVEMHDGNIKVFSEGEGLGSTFLLELPLKQKLITKSVSTTKFMQESRKPSVLNLSFLNWTNSKDSESKEIPVGSHSFDLPFTPPKEHTFSASFTSIDENQSLSKERWERKLNFLVVDDSTLSCKLLKKTLEKHGHSAMIAEDGTECVELVRNLIVKEKVKSRVEGVSFNAMNELTKESTDPDDETIKKMKDITIDIILIDDNMPRMSGVEAAGHLRAMGFKGLIYGVTGDVGVEKNELFLSQGANKVFTKPLDIMQLKNSVNKLWNEAN